MVSKSKLKAIKGLQRKKNRQLEQLFVAEGYKTINELSLAGFTMVDLWTSVDTSLLALELQSNIQYCTALEMKSMSSMSTPPGYLAVFKMPHVRLGTLIGLNLMLDQIRDPGNMGTIIRMCDWFGIENVLCTPGTIDCYNPKVIQATMGSLARVQIHYLDTLQVQDIMNSHETYSAVMDGENLYKMTLPKTGILIMGNESEGISEALISLSQKRITIPRYGALQATESLNVATATSIILSEWRRQAIEK